MAELTQSEINSLIGMEKSCTETKTYSFVMKGKKLSVPLVSKDKREEFILDLNRRSIDVSKVTYQNRARKSIVLLRLDLGGQPHRNPNGTEIPTPHLHIYQEGYEDKIAMKLPDCFANCQSIVDYLDVFMDYCHICKKPNIDRGLFDEQG